MAVYSRRYGSVNAYWFAHNEERRFLANVAGSKGLGLWVAERIGLPAETAHD
jgi:hypothetical protein